MTTKNLTTLAMQKGRRVEAIDPKAEFTPTQIKRLQKQLSEHTKGTSKSMNLNQVKNVLGV